MQKVPESASAPPWSVTELDALRAACARIEAAPWNVADADKSWVWRLLERGLDADPSYVLEAPDRGPLGRLLHTFEARDVRCLVIGGAGADLHARRIGRAISTLDFDVFLPNDAKNLLTAWNACTASGFTLWCGREPLDEPRDLDLARAVVAATAATRAVADGAPPVDLSLSMGGLDFEDVWLRRVERRELGAWIDLARLADILEAKRRVDRPKDRAFLGQHADLLRELLADESTPDAPRP